MFVFVLYGEKESSIFNPNCRCISFLATIKEKCNFSEDILDLSPVFPEQLHTKNRVDIDLSDESGNVKNLRDMPYRYANEFLADRERVILLRVDSHESGDCAYTPLLHDDDCVSEGFLAKLASRAMDLTRPISRRNRGSASRKGRHTSQERDVKSKNGQGASNSASKGTKPTPRSKSRIK